MLDTRKKLHQLDEINEKLSSWETKKKKAQQIKDYLQTTIYELTKFSSCPHHIKGEEIEIQFDFDNRDENLLKFINTGEELSVYDYVIHFESSVELLEKVYNELEEAELANLKERGYDFGELGTKIYKILKLI
jgi:DNA repair ATPase RecN